ncbi:MAG: hypothetical protein RIU46_04645 [Deltaproteobacteria bacterium]
MKNDLGSIDPLRRLALTTLVNARQTERFVSAALGGGTVSKCSVGLDPAASARLLQLTMAGGVDTPAARNIEEAREPKEIRKHEPQRLRLHLRIRK